VFFRFGQLRQILITLISRFTCSTQGIATPLICQFHDKIIDNVHAEGGVKMPSVDVVSKVDIQTLYNAINNVKREVSTRFDFRNIKTEITFDRKAKSVHIVTGDDWKMKAISEMLAGQCSRLKFDSKCLDFKTMEPTAQGMMKMDISIKEGITKETGQKMVKLIKGTKLKVQPAIQEDHVRITGKNIDDLQEIMQLLREQDYDIPLQFVNMKS